MTRLLGFGATVMVVRGSRGDEALGGDAGDGGMTDERMATAV